MWHIKTWRSEEMLRVKYVGDGDLPTMIGTGSPFKSIKYLRHYPSQI